MDTKKRNRFWQLHSILGIALGLPLFIIFVAGTLAFLEPLAIHWLRPEFGDPPAQAPALNGTIAKLLEKYPETDEIAVVPAHAEHPVIDVYLEENHVPSHYWLNPHTLESTPATEHDADLFHFFVDLHYFDFIPYGKELTGLIAALFFTIILTGIVYQWRTMRKDAHPKNLSLEGRGRWKNIHRFTSLLTLPFQALYSVTGASLALGLLLAAPAVYLFFGGKTEALNTALFPGLMATAPPPAEGAPFPLDEAIAKAKAHWPENVSLRLIQLANLGPEHGNPATRTIKLHGKQDGAHLVGTHLLTLDGNLDILHDQSPTSHLAPMLIEGLVNVHFATFNALLIKVLFVIGGFIVSLSIAAGVMIFLQRRQQGSTKNSRLTRLLEFLTHWTVGGLTLATAISLHAAHLFPQVPVHVFAGMAFLSLIAVGISTRSLPWLTRIAAIAFLALPLTFAIVHKENPFQWGTTHAWMITGFNVFFVLCAIGVYWLTVRLSARPEPAE